MDNTVQQIQQLQGAVKGLTKLLQGNKQNTQPQQIPQFVPDLNIDNSLPQNSRNQNPANPQGGRGGYRGQGGREEVQFYAIGVETSYLKNMLLIK